MQTSDHLDEIPQVLLIPSVLSPIERNALFNPAHPLATSVLADGLQGQPFQMDARLFKMQ